MKYVLKSGKLKFNHCYFAVVAALSELAASNDVTRGSKLATVESWLRQGMNIVSKALGGVNRLLLLG